MISTTIRAQATKCMAIASLLALTAGCGNSRGTVPVSGTVTHQGQPVSPGLITFVPDDGALPSAMSELDSSGRYRLGTLALRDGAMPGTYRVMIESRGPDKPVPDEMQGQMMDEDMQGSGDPLIPIKYFTTEGSGLTAEVEKGSNVFDFDLE